MSARPDLAQALPADVLSSNVGRWFGYKHFPVFSWPWLWRRSLLFALALVTVAVVSGLGLWATLGQWTPALRAGAYFVTGFLGMACIGPVLATLVRHARWPLRRELAGLVMAITVGLVSAYFVDAWSSAGIRAAVEPGLNVQGPRNVQVVVHEQPADDASALSPRRIAGTLFVLGMYSLLGGGWALRGYFGERRRWQQAAQQREIVALRTRAQSADLRMAVLQAQVEPHFLFNTLASLRSVIRQDPARAEATIDALVDHLRATIPRLRDESMSLHSTLGQQVDICESYLVLMSVRMGPRLQVTIDVPAALREVAFPPLMLISLVENAIKHGIEPKPGPGQITLQGLQTTDGALSMRVIDDGRGLTIGLTTGLSAGMGLANIRDQLATRFGTRARLTIESLPGGGTLAEITIPLDFAPT